jgi:hypothetical protein
MRSVLIVIVVVLLTAGCSGGGGGSSSGGGGGGASKVYGTWAGTLNSKLESAKGGQSVSFVVRTDTGTSFTGILAVSSSLCLPGGEVAGSQSGNRITFSGRNPFGGPFTVSGTISGNTISATYTSVGSFSCNTTDTGSIKLQKVYETPIA